MPSPAQRDDEYDLVVLGAGAGGMTAALVAAIEGLRTLVIERTRWIGGTTARSSGTVWIPDNPHQRRLGILDDAQAAVGFARMSGQQRMQRRRQRGCSASDGNPSAR